MKAVRIAAVFCVVWTAKGYADPKAGLGEMTSLSDKLFDVPLDLGEEITLDAYIKAVLTSGLERNAANIDLRIARSTFQQFFREYYPRPSISANESRSINSAEERTQSTNRSAALNLSGQSPYGISWSVKSPSLSMTRNESSSEFAQSTVNHNAQIGAGVTMKLLRDSYFVVGSPAETRSRLSYTNSQWQYKQTIQSLVNEAESTYFQLIFSFLSLRIQNNAVKEAKSLLDATKQKMVEGEVDKLSVLQAELQLAQSENALIDAQEAFSKDQQKFIEKIDPSRQGEKRFFPNLRSLLRHPPKPDITLDVAVQIAKENQPAFNISKNNFEMQKIGLRESKSALWPELNLSTEYNLNGSDQAASEALSMARRGENKSVSVNLSLTYIPANNPAETNYKNALLGFKKAQADHDLSTAKLVTSIIDRLSAIESAYRKLKTSELTANLAFEKVKAERYKFQLGESTIKSVIEFQKEYEQAQIGLMRTRSEILLALSAFKAAVGGDLPGGGNNDRN